MRGKESKHSRASQKRAAVMLHRKLAGALFQILKDSPDARRGKFEQVSVDIAKVKAPATQFPCAFFLYRDSHIKKTQGCR
jgi:hypothetical protein